jgi:hypothetical protein
LQLIRIQAAEGKVCLYAFGFQCTKVGAAQVQIQLYLFQFYLRQGRCVWRRLCRYYFVLYIIYLVNIMSVNIFYLVLSHCFKNGSKNAADTQPAA